MAAERIIFYIPGGSGIRAAAQDIAHAGVRTNAGWLAAYLRLAGAGQTIKAGEYRLERGAKPADLLAMLVRGDHLMRSVTLVEGWTFAQVRHALDQVPYLEHATQGWPDEKIMAALGHEGTAPEGRFFPDTYQYTRGSSDLAVLRQALQLMERKLNAAWQARAPGLPLKSTDEALVLASLVEKETGRDRDRAEVAGVFIKRLQRGMPLQTDPSVIYGLGDRFQGALTRGDLRADTAFNTYMRRGLPPTPIAMPGQAALMAAVRPAQTPSLYFVARGDGSSQFSRSLDEHNRAVRRYRQTQGTAAP